MNYCENCGSEVQDGRFCPKCGYEVGMLPKNAILASQNHSPTEKKAFFDQYQQYQQSTIERKIFFWIFLPFFYIFYVGHNLVDNKSIPSFMRFVLYVIFFYIGSVAWFLWAFFLAFFPILVLLIPFLAVFDSVMLLYLCLALLVFSPFYILGYVVYAYIWKRKRQPVPVHNSNINFN